MIRVLSFIIFPVFLFGCVPYPRYQTGGAESARKAVQAEKGMTTNDNLRFGSILQSYLGRPYTGRSKYVEGVDCSYFVGDVFDTYDAIKLPRTVHGQFRTGTDVPYRQLQYGDLVFYRTERNRVSHVGIYVGDARFIHASTSRGVIITSMKEDYWSKRYAGARRILGVVTGEVNKG